MYSFSADQRLSWLVTMYALGVMCNSVGLVMGSIFVPSPDNKSAQIFATLGACTVGYLTYYLGRKYFITTWQELVYFWLIISFVFYGLINLIEERRKKNYGYA
jgi:hypothetical protein